MGCYPYERTFGRGVGNVREGTRDIAEGSGTCSMHVEQEWVRICKIV